ncbi:hypothetical protein [Pseudomonas sp. PDM04]|uniref:hypothetical protein n=1 Tax=Pseudomonas sp. PDM04 TaxID=2769296 RepID=UPI0017844586|nr:hypothetical protein [Pseudomonas sp. PDM04]MBD9443089.1 hypothetical protein [Pseudomonas sp. PDM04]
MSETIHSAILAAAGPRSTPDAARAHAVAVALELIASKASGGEGLNIPRELDNLSNYADQIQEALKVK